MEEERSKILIVEDERSYLKMLVELLRRDYRTYIAVNGLQALERAAENPPDLIVLDIMMPGMDGFDVCRCLKGNPQTNPIPIIFLTGRSTIEDETRAFECGAVDFITKPICASTVLARVKTHVTLKKTLELLAHQNELLEQKVIERTREVSLTQDAAIYAMASLVEARDNETGGHVRRTQHYVRTLAEQLGKTPRYLGLFDAKTVELLYKSAPLHDIGKVAVPDRILKKLGVLTREEFEEMKKHPIHGRDAVLRAEKELGSNSFLRFAREIAYCHQEKWDGSGYPQGLKGEEIPISARLMALGDVYDALISKRVYKHACTHQEAVEYIINERGKHFDPEVVDAFLQSEGEFERIAGKFSDAEEVPNVHLEEMGSK